MKQVWIISAFLFVAFGVIAAGIYIWQAIGPVSLSIHGWLAVGAGVSGSFLLGGGLMWLSFYSARSGHDQAAADEQEKLEKRK